MGTRMLIGKIARILTGANINRPATTPFTPHCTWDGVDLPWLGSIAPEGTILTAPIYPGAAEQRVFYKHGPHATAWESTGSTNMGDLETIARSDTIIGTYGSLPAVSVTRWGY